jgi:ectoine hydroxylase-related dioxygenase (phytanoyl-CoA dioxygenase family)
MKTLDDHLSQQLQEDGFCITESLFDESTLAGVRSEFDRMWRENIASVEAKGDSRDIHAMRTKPFLTYLDRRSEICKAFIRHPAFAQRCLALIGPDVDVVWNQAIIKPPSEGQAFGWHQDAHYAVNGPYAKDTDHADLLDPSKTITFWVAITRTIVDNGTLWVVPGLHRQGLLPHTWSEENREWQLQFDNAWRIPAVLRPGQSLIFTNCTPHGSGANISGEIRMAYQIGFAIPGLVNSDSPVPLLRQGKAVK